MLCIVCKFCCVFCWICDYICCILLGFIDLDSDICVRCVGKINLFFSRENNSVKIIIFVKLVSILFSVLLINSIG